MHTQHTWHAVALQICLHKTCWVRHLLVTWFLNTPIGHTKIERLIVNILSNWFRSDLEFQDQCSHDAVSIQPSPLEIRSSMPQVHSMDKWDIMWLHELVGKESAYRNFQFDKSVYLIELQTRQILLSISCHYILMLCDMCCLVALTFFFEITCRLFQAMPWPHDFVDKLTYRLNAFGAPKVSCQQMFPSFNPKSEQTTWLDIIELMPWPCLRLWIFRCMRMAL